MNENPMNRRISDILDGIERYPLRVRDDEEAQIERIKEGVLRKIHDAGGTPFGEARRTPRRALTGLLTAALALTVFGATAFAAWTFLAPADVAERMSARQIAEAFRGENAIEMNLTQSDGDLEITLLGAAPGDAIKMYRKKYADGSEFGTQGADLYAILALRSESGRPVSAEDLRVHSLLKAPERLFWQNTLNVDTDGSFAEDGVLYIAVKVETLGDCLLVSDTDDLKSAFDYDDYTFNITPKADYAGINVAFPIPRSDLGVTVGELVEFTSPSERRAALEAKADRYMRMPLESCTLVADSVKVVTDSYEYQGDGWGIGGAIKISAMPFDENGIFRSGCVGTENGAMLIVFKRDADGTVRGMLYEAISQD